MKLSRRLWIGLSFGAALLNVFLASLNHAIGAPSIVVTLNVFSAAMMFVACAYHLTRRE
jgi:hypothetical protein